MAPILTIWPAEGNAPESEENGVGNVEWAVFDAAVPVVTPSAWSRHAHTHTHTHTHTHKHTTTDTCTHQKRAIGARGRNAILKRTR